MKSIPAMILLFSVMIHGLFGCDEVLIVDENRYFTEKHPFELEGEEISFILVTIHGNPPGQCGAIQMTAFLDESDRTSSLKPVSEVKGIRTEYLISDEKLLSESCSIFVRVTCNECTVSKAYLLKLGSLERIITKVSG